MIYLLYGPDTFLIREKLNRIREKFLASQPAFNLTQLNASQLKSADELVALLGGSTLLGGKRLLVLFDLLNSGEDTVKEGLNKAIRQGLPDDLVVILCENLDFDKRQSLFKLLNKPKTAQFFSPLTGSSLLRFAKTLAEKKNLTIDDTHLRQILSITGTDLWRLDNELTKLASYCKTHPLSPIVIQELVTTNLESNLFTLMDAVASHDAALVNKLFNDLLNHGEDPIGLLAILTFQLHNLILIKSLSAKRLSVGEIIRETGLHPYAVSNTLKQTNRFSLDWLNSAYKQLMSVDQQIKTGVMNPADALDQLLVSFSH